MAEEKQYILRTVREARRSVRSELSAWKTAALFLFAISIATNMALIGMYSIHKQQWIEQSEIMNLEIEAAERLRDNALQELGRLSQKVAVEKLSNTQQEEAYKEVSAYQYVGECQITYYCPCKVCCGSNADGLTATGIPATPGVIAVDPDIIPLGSTVIIDGKKYLAADTGSVVKGLHIDICVADHEEAISNGVGLADVWRLTIDG